MMERALKERVVGAVVLVIIAVLVVPVFLDGPGGNEPDDSETVILPAPNGQTRSQQTIVLDRNRSEPVPVATDTSDQPQAPAESDTTAGAGSAADTTTAERPDPAAASTTAEQPPQSAPEAVDEPPPATATAEAATESAADDRSATGMWAVQLGSFSNAGNAERLAAELRGKGYAAFLSKVKAGSKTLNRVRIGPQKDRENAAAMAARLAADGYKGQVVPHP